MTDQTPEQRTLAILRGQLTIAEDALRDLADPTSMVTYDEDGSWIDACGSCRVAEGALRRMREYEESRRS